MTLPQIEALAIIAGMLILFVTDRLRYDLVAALALSAAVLTGVVPAKKAFEGFANPVIIIIASVLVMNPQVLLFDEPTAALDPRTQQWLLELIVALNEAGKTIVLATHDLERLDLVADRCVVFSEGHRIVAEGSPGEILGDRDLLLGVNLIHEHTRERAAAYHS